MPRSMPCSTSSADRPPATSNGHRTDDDVAFSRAQVYQAAGMVMAQLGVSIEEATVRLHAYAFANDRPLVDVARDIVRRTFAPGRR